MRGRLRFYCALGLGRWVWDFFFLLPSAISRYQLPVEMEVAVPVAMESLYRPPALVWAMASAVVLFWGTGLIASKKLIKQGVYPLSWLAILRRQVADGFWICAEEFLYGVLALMNMFLGVVFWILDFYYEGRPPLNANYFPVANPLQKVTEPDLRNPEVKKHEIVLKPRRAGILRPRKVTGNLCGCWGYEVPELLSADHGVFANGAQVWCGGFLGFRIDGEHLMSVCWILPFLVD